MVVQTTQSRERFEEVLDALEGLHLDLEVKDTICFATTQRQLSAVELAEQVDAMVVIGGRNSSNTTRLFEICAPAPIISSVPRRSTRHGLTDAALWV